jgi:hypothetical protein
MTQVGRERPAHIESATRSLGDAFTDIGTAATFARIRVARIRVAWIRVAWICTARICIARKCVSPLRRAAPRVPGVGIAPRPSIASRALAFIDRREHRLIGGQGVQLGVDVLLDGGKAIDIAVAGQTDDLGARIGSVEHLEALDEKLRLERDIVIDDQGEHAGAQAFGALVGEYETGTIPRPELLDEGELALGQEGPDDGVGADAVRGEAPRHLGGRVLDVAKDAKTGGLLAGKKAEEKLELGLYGDVPGLLEHTLGLCDFTLDDKL